MRGMRIKDETGIFIVMENTHAKHKFKETIHIVEMKGYKILLNTQSDTDFLEDTKEQDYNLNSYKDYVRNKSLSFHIEPLEVYC
mmetsp:Transcript_28133/g.62034  ORF Transcript_28133/g.62034 Transcript_28133/m.62034 type:complete len:84 (+) Transcript_28133:250-501(+)